VSFAFLRKRLRNLSWLRRRRDRRHALGSRGERLAARSLKRRGHRIIARNYRSPAGEIDLITQDDETLVFVEVKTRTSDDAADLQEAIGPTQRRRIEHAARYFLMRQSAHDHPCRFDVITVLWPAHGSPKIEHFEDAFAPRRP
jgi:putative endonuclease